jgi:hypothetical protein
MSSEPLNGRIYCLTCGDIYNRQSALARAIARVENNQAASIYAAGIAYFLNDAGFNFAEISAFLDQHQSEVLS